MPAGQAQCPSANTEMSGHTHSPFTTVASGSAHAHTPFWSDCPTPGHVQTPATAVEVSGQVCANNAKWTREFNSMQQRAEGR